ncbi:MAG: hypothetical protein V4640_00920 [Verrucomicrobiota bacterium]
MTHDPNSLEAELRTLRAAPLDEALLARLEAAADGTLTEMSPDEICFEQQLRAISPAPLAADHLAELQSLFRDVPFPVDEKIVLFPKPAVAKPAATRLRPMWSAAAAVAIIGAATALMLPTSSTPERKFASQPIAPSATLPSATKTNSNLVPAGFNRGVSNVSDEGLIWQNDTQPHSLMRVEYVDKITLKDGKGRTYQVERPGFRYMLVPAKTD